jgi:hypothetical protein
VVRLAPLSSFCHTNEYIRIQKNYNSPKRLNQDSGISRIISKPVGARLALYEKFVCAAKRAIAMVAPAMFSAAKFDGNTSPQHCDTCFRDHKLVAAPSGYPLSCAKSGTNPPNSVFPGVWVGKQSGMEKQNERHIHRPKGRQNL